MRDYRSKAGKNRLKQIRKMKEVMKKKGFILRKIYGLRGQLIRIDFIPTQLLSYSIEKGLMVKVKSKLEHNIEADKLSQSYCSTNRDDSSLPQPFDQMVQNIWVRCFCNDLSKTLTNKQEEEQNTYKVGENVVMVKDGHEYSPDRYVQKNELIQKNGALNQIREYLSKNYFN